MLSEEECVKHTGECWDKGFNCAESALRGVCHAQGIVLPPVALMMATPFGGGVGRSEDLCGALSGAILAIGASLGRTEGKGEKGPSYQAAKKQHDMFLQRFGSTSCKVLNKGDFKSNEHERRCKELTLESARMAYRIINEQKARKP